MSDPHRMRSRHTMSVRSRAAAVACGVASLAALAAPAFAQTTAPANGEARVAIEQTSAASMRDLIAAVASDDGAAAGRARRAILFDHPESDDAAYLIATTDAEDLREVYAGGLLPRDWFDPTPSEVARALAALARPVERHRAEFLKVDDFLLRVGLIAADAARSHPDPATRDRAAALASDVYKRFESAPATNDTRGPALAALAPDATPAGALDQLAAFKDRAAVAPYELWIIGRLSDEQRADPAMLRSAALVRVHAGPSEEAAAAFDRLAAIGGIDSARLAYLHGLTWAYAGDATRSADLLRDAAAAYPDDPWGRVAGELAGVVPGVEAERDRQADAMYAVVEDLARRTQVVELRLRLAAGDRAVVVYAAVEPASLDVQVGVDGRTIARYRTAADHADLQLSAEPVTYRFAGAVLVPTATVSHDDRGGGNAELKVGMDLATVKPDDEPPPPVAVRGLDRASIRWWLAGDGVLPAATVVDPGRTTLRRVRPPVESPDGGGPPTLGRSEVTIGPGDVVAGEVELGPSSAVEFRFGPAGSFNPDPPPWPDLPVVERGEMDGPQMMGLLSKVAAAIGPAMKEAGESAGGFGD